MLEGHQYTLQCEVQKVAPIERLQVAFYKGQTRLALMQSNRSIELKKPESQIFNLNVTASKEDNGVSCWCEAMLDLKMLQPPPVVRSTNMTARVHCKSKDEPSSAALIIILLFIPVTFVLTFLNPLVSLPAMPFLTTKCACTPGH